MPAHHAKRPLIAIAILAMARAWLRFDLNEAPSHAPLGHARKTPSL